MREIVLNDEENLNNEENCEHKFLVQGNVKVEGIIWDIYYCSKCLTHAKKERPCPLNMDDMVRTQSQETSALFSADFERNC